MIFEVVNNCRSVTYSVVNHGFHADGHCVFCEDLEEVYTTYVMAKTANYDRLSACKFNTHDHYLMVHTQGSSARANYTHF